MTLDLLHFRELTPEHVHFSAMIKLLEFTRVYNEMEISILKCSFGYSFNTKRGDISLHRRVSVPFDQASRDTITVLEVVVFIIAITSPLSFRVLNICASLR